MKTSIKVIFIDWNGTLSSSKFFGHLEETNLELFTKIQNTLFSGGKLEHLLNPWMIGDFNTEFVLKHLTGQLQYPYKELFNEFVLSCQNMTIKKEVLELIKIIRSKGIKIVIATDNMDSFDRWTIPALKLNDHFDEILNSYSLKSRKKDFDKYGKSLFFEKYLKENNTKPEETVLIDDSEDKDNAIAKYGVSYLQLRSPNDLLNILKGNLSQH